MTVCLLSRLWRRRFLWWASSLPSVWVVCSEGSLNGDRPRQRRSEPGLTRPVKPAPRRLPGSPRRARARLQRGRAPRDSGHFGWRPMAPRRSTPKHKPPCSPGLIRSRLSSGAADHRAERRVDQTIPANVAIGCSDAVRSAMQAAVVAHRAFDFARDDWHDHRSGLIPNKFRAKSAPGRRWMRRGSLRLTQSTTRKPSCGMSWSRCNGAGACSQIRRLSGRW